MFRRFNALWKYLILLLVISLTILIVNNIYKGEDVIPKVVVDINNGVIGAILTTIITLVLLSNQTEKELVSNKNAVVFEEKLKIFNEFLHTLSDSVKDSRLTNEEIKVILYSFAKIRIHMSPENASKIAAALQSVNAELFYVNENEIPDIESHNRLYNKICNVFRDELYGHSGSEEFENFNFSNLAEITFTPRASKVPVSDIDTMINYLNSVGRIIFEKKGAQRIVFSIASDLSENFRSIYASMSEIKESLTESFFLRKFIINGKNYLGLPSVRYLLGNTKIVSLSITEMKRIQVCIYFDGDKDYSTWIFEDDLTDSEKSDRIKAIAKDIKKGISIISSKSKEETDKKQI